ncbi:GLPGLI family protein [Chryseobacterium sp. SORGH_AS 447]|uniref:GLPGLI family protein n=1 Tax=Chryseobacterium sp. SORGH_AS_0447 TaxID=3041769 RepID=UPI0027874272|nr:GLPGLI family protein [Chryseobacterium sp. SORGH_AS_0447]MDQ1161875.1 GLPGLI family protein [Chryseobacterium sp. SORGH_AS_0447]
MKKFLAFGCLVLGILTQAQINRFFYEYKFIPDSNNKEDVKNEMMYLDIDQKGSTYYSRDKFVSDSITNVEIQKQMKSNSGNMNINRKEKQGQVSYKVTKAYPDFTTYLFRSISSDRYKIKEGEKPEWKILSDKQKIGEYNTQKATTSFGGREWIAWFSTDIPFQDGPYKFYGLPGLIVKIEDTTGSHIMTLVGNKKIAEVSSSDKEPELPQNIRVFGMGGKELEVTENQFRKVWKDYVNDPTKNMRQMMGGSGDVKVSFKFKDPSGKEVSDPNEVLRAMEKNTKERLAKDNNPIEPDLVK